VVKSTRGPVIEFGCGDGSTALLHEICKESGRILVSLDDDLKWLDKSRKKYLGDGYEPDNSGWHKFYFVPGRKNRVDPEHWITFLDEFDLLEEVDFEVCFIDQGQWLSRYETIKRLKDKIRYIILHDYDYFPEFGIFGKIIRSTNQPKNIPGIYDFSAVFQYFTLYWPSRRWPGPTGPPTLVASNFDANFLDIDYSKYPMLTMQKIK